MSSGIKSLDPKKILKDEDQEKWEIYLREFCFNEQNLISNLNLESKNFFGWDFSRISFSDSVFDSCSFDSCKFRQNSISGCEFFACSFNNTDWSSPQQKISLNRSSFNSCEFEYSKIYSLSVYDVDFFECSFRNLTLGASGFEKVRFRECDFSNSRIWGIVFGHPITWDDCKIDSKTTFKDVQFEPNYDVVNDASETIKYSSFLDLFFNWKRIHFMSNFPVFGVSWSAFVISIFLVNSIAAINSSRFIKTFDYPIPIPESIGFIIVSSLMLGLSSAIYKIKCPEILQNFTEVQWVYEHKHPRVQYILGALTTELWRMSCMILLLLGGAIAVYITGANLSKAILYLIT